MTSFVQLGLAAIAALTALSATAIVMTTKERIATRRQDDYVAMQREAMAHNTRNVRTALRSLEENDG